MKRSFSLLLVLFFVLSCMALPAFAVEAEEYVFEVVPPISLYGDYIFSGFDQIGLYEGYVPEGLYYVYGAASPDSDWFLYLDSPISVEYSLVDETLLDEPFVYSCTVVYPDDPYSPEIWITDTYESQGYTGLLMKSIKGLSSLGDGLIKLVPVEYSSPQISSIVSSDMLAGSIDEVVELLPVVLVVIVAFIGIRKGISFLLQILHSA